MKTTATRWERLTFRWRRKRWPKENLHEINGVPVIESEKAPGVLTLVPVPKNPHGCNVTPDGKYVLASGKLSPTVSIIDAKTLKVIAEPEVGLGPLHPRLTAVAMPTRPCLWIRRS